MKTDDEKYYTQPIVIKHRQRTRRWEWDAAEDAIEIMMNAPAKSDEQKKARKP